MNNINARKYVSDGFPPDEGGRLANALMDSSAVDWNKLQIDLTQLPPSLLISAFFNGFLQTLVDRRPELLKVARQITWKVPFDFQRENIARWMKDFRPYDRRADQSRTASQS